MIEYFEELNEQGEVVEKPRPTQYSQKDVLDILIRHWPNKESSTLSVIGDFIEGLKWYLFDTYKKSVSDFENELERISAEIKANSDDPDYVATTYHLTEPVFSWVHKEYGDIEDVSIEDFLNLEPFSSAISTKHKENRAESVNNIVVTVDGMEFDGDEVSQGRMARAIIAMQLTGQDQTDWKLHNNVKASVSLTQMSQALALAGQAQTAIWFE